MNVLRKCVFFLYTVVLDIIFFNIFFQRIISVRLPFAVQMSVLSKLQFVKQELNIPLHHFFLALKKLTGNK